MPIVNSIDATGAVSAPFSCEYPHVEEIVTVSIELGEDAFDANHAFLAQPGYGVPDVLWGCLGILQLNSRNSADFHLCLC